MSGHSKWSTIKRKKAAADAKRGNIFTRHAREIAIAAREGGGDPDTNFALRLAVDRAKADNMPKENIERAIKRGTGEDKSEATLEQIMYEGYAPNGIALMIDVVTDNRKRTVSDIRHTLTRSGGTMSEVGAVSWQFQQTAYFYLLSEGINPEEIFNLAVDHGADDIIIGDEDIEIYAPVELFKEINDLLEKHGVTIEEAALRMIPRTRIELPLDKTLQVMRLIENLEECDDVQEVFSNLEITDEAVEQLEAA
jgi:YebC/PmpR family DNA-binding regulatory protein